MKKIISFFIVLCMLAPSVWINAEEEEKETKVYLFGDEWAACWADELKGYFRDEALFVNEAHEGDLLSNAEKLPSYEKVQKGDIVLISYGVLEKERPGDKNAVFKTKLEEMTADITKRGARVIFVSVASTMRYNSLTGQMEETKNFYTETTRSWAKKNAFTYVDLAKVTAECANRLKSQNASKLYKSAVSLTKDGNRMCAYEVFKVLKNEECLKGELKSNFSAVYDVAPGEKRREIDLLFENEISDRFAVFTKGGVNVAINGISADGDETVVKSDGKITLTFDSCEKIQISPIIYFDAKGVQTTETAFSGEMLPGVYDVRVKKSEPLKASVYLNGYLTASNLDMPGTQEVTSPAEHVFERYHFDGGKFEVKVVGLTDKLDYIAFCETNTFKLSRTRIFVGGDSTLCNYYPLERSGNEEDGTVMTGWAMLLENYVDADAVNLAASGYWASKWQELNFNIVEKEGEKGDLFILQFGINDRYYSTVDEMVKSLEKMIDIAANKGMIPILVSPQISAGYGWGDETNVGKSDGGDYEEFFNAVRSLAEKKGCFYVDLTDLSAGWFSEIGRDAVYKKYHIWDYEENKPKDMMHLSYKGADAMCSFFVHGLKQIADSGSYDKWENTLALLKIR